MRGFWTPCIHRDTRALNYVQGLSRDITDARLRLGWIARRVVGNRGFVILNKHRNLVATDPLDEAGLREWLIGTLKERRRAYYW